MRALSSALLLLTLTLGAPSVAGALTLNPVGEFERPTFVTSEPADPDRLIVSEQLGTVRLTAAGKVTTLADLTSLIGCPEDVGCKGERGLMSAVPAPDYATSGHLYVDYIANASGQIHVDELTVTEGFAPLSTRRPLLTIEHSQAANHNGGQLGFGPDGHLYVSTGDGGSANDEFHHAQKPTDPLGKLLRLDPGAPGTPVAYEIWSTGLRNPFRFSFDALDGDLVIGDVGQGAREEVDLAPRLPGGGVGGGGVNWGWNCREGFIAGPADDLPQGECASIFGAGGFADPVFDYPHTDPGTGAAHGCAIIGGYVARDPSLGDLYGRYVYSDLCVGDIRSLQLPESGSGRATGDRSEGASVSSPVSFGEDSCRRLYVVEGGGGISRLEGASPATCAAGEPPPGGGGNGPGEGPGKQLPPTPPPKRRTHAHLSASLSGEVTPCAGRDHQRVMLNRGGRQVAARALDERCHVGFSRKVRHHSTFRLVVPATGDYRAGRSRPVAIDP